MAVDLFDLEGYGKVQCCCCGKDYLVSRDGKDIIDLWQEGDRIIEFEGEHICVRCVPVMKKLNKEGQYGEKYIAALEREKRNNFR